MLIKRENICFLQKFNRNKRNFNLDNLILTTNRQLLIMNAKKLIKNDADLTRIGLNLAKLYEKIGEKNRG